MHNDISIPYLQTNEMTETYNAILMFEEFLICSKDDPYYYKWAVLAIHNALQCLMVLALKGTSPLSIIIWKDDYNGKTAYEILSKPDQKLKHFLVLFDMIKHSASMNNSRLFESNGISRHIKELNQLRNEFVHYQPKHWSIGIKGLSLVFLDVLKFVDYLVKECLEVRRNFDEHQQKDIITIIETCNALLSNF